MDPDPINCVILRIHVDKNNDIIPSYAIKQRTSVSTRYGSKKISLVQSPALAKFQTSFKLWITWNEILGYQLDCKPVFWASAHFFKPEPAKQFVLLFLHSSSALFYI